MRALFCTLALLIPTVPGQLSANDQLLLLEQCADRLSTAEKLTGKFRQEKHVDFLDTPLVSSGTFSISRSGGMSWRVSDPVESVMEVHGTTVTLNGEPVRGYGMGRMMSVLMKGFMQGDFSGMTRHFEVSGEVSDTDWELMLLPRSRRMISAIETISLAGDHHLQYLQIHEKGGNRSLIHFSDVHPVESDDEQGQ